MPQRTTAVVHDFPGTVFPRRITSVGDVSLRAPVLIVTALCLLSAGCAAGSLGRLGARFEAGYFRPELSGDFQVDGSGLTGTDVDLQGVADLPSDEDVLHGAAALSLAGFTLSLSGWQASLRGDTTLTAPLNFNGQSFVVSERLVTDMDLINGTATLEYSLSPIEEVYLGVGVGVDVFDVELRMQQPSLGIDETFDETFPIPVVSVSAEFNPFDFVGAYVSARGLYGRSEWIGLDDTVQGTARFFDIVGGVRAKWSFLFATAGYKWILLDLGLDDARVDIDLQGFFGSVGVEF